ncbi:MAG: hypothetical protein J6B76_07115 [Peptococcaceae bacterium]|nr:hypothetical protein [Peptococcaceae bacterium]
MQRVYLDITAEQFMHNRILQSALPEFERDAKRGARYHRVYLKNDTAEDIMQLLAQMTIEESVHWILHQHKQQLSQLAEPAQFYAQLRERIQSVQPKLALFVQHDIAAFCKRHEAHSTVSWNIEGYLLFAAKKLKWMVDTIVQDIYQSCKEEQEREEFIALLQFCASAQQSLLDDVYITLAKDRFTMLDVWGNDLQQIYLDALPAEEYMDVQMHDLLLSILMTMLPKTIHLFVVKEQLDDEERQKQQNLLQLLQQIFGDKICMGGSL